MREEFSLFSLGIGFDVDYDFLERIAMENRGMAQRIYANHDAAEQLRVRQGNTTKKKNPSNSASLTFFLQISNFLKSKVFLYFKHLIFRHHTPTYW